MLFLFLFILITSLFTRYQGNYHPFYTGLYDFIKNPKLFQNDIYFLNSLLQESSIFMAFLNTQTFHLIMIFCFWTLLFFL